MMQNSTKTITTKNEDDYNFQIIQKDNINNFGYVEKKNIIISKIIYGI